MFQWQIQTFSWGGGGGGGHPDPEIRGAARFKKISFRPLGPHFGLEITVGGGGSGPGEFIDVYQATWPSGQSALDLLSGGCQ